MSALTTLGIKSITLAELVAGVIPTQPTEARKASALMDVVREAGALAYGNKVRINSPRAAAAYLIPKCKGLTEERFGLLALNAKGDLLAETVISMGTTTATLLSPREVFREALRLGASSVLVYHNHPSGDPTPSREDTLLTHRLRSAGESLGIPLADHIVVGFETTHSFRAAEGWDHC